jgi:hypothetical protein
VTRHIAPGLRAWLDNVDGEVHPARVVLAVRFWPVMFDGKDPPRAVPRELWGRDYFQTAEEPPIPLEPTSEDNPPFI